LWIFFCVYPKIAGWIEWFHSIKEKENLGGIAVVGVEDFVLKSSEEKPIYSFEISWLHGLSQGLQNVGI